MPDIKNLALLQFIAHVELCSELSQRERDAILNLESREKHLGTGDDLLRPGDTVAHATLVVKGNVARFDPMRRGTRQITAIYMAGDMCDLFSVVVPTAGWGLTALNVSTVLQIPHAQIIDLVRRYPNLAMVFWRETVLDAMLMSHWITNLGSKDARARIASLLCELGLRMERAGIGKRDNYVLDLTQLQIGDAMGLTHVHVNRTLGRLKNEGLLNMQERRICITDWDHLAEVAEIVPTFLIPCSDSPEREVHRAI